MNRTQLGIKIYDASHITGNFLLRSGQTSHEYFDKYLFESDTNLLNEIAEHLQKILPDNHDIIAGLEMGGIPIAVFLSSKTGLPTIFVRKKAKEYGTCKLAEGTDFKNKNVLVIEDVVTTGGQIIDSVNSLRELGAIINYVMCVIVRDAKAFENLKAANLELIPLFTMEELKELTTK